MPDQDLFLRQRESMVTGQLEARGIKDEGVLAAFLKVPRDRFIQHRYKGEAYGDHPVSIGSGQTISQPYMVALMTESLRLKKADKVLEIGTGSGYQAAILAELSKEVYTVERISSLVKDAEETLGELGYSNIHFRCDDGSTGWREHAPYDGIIVTCGSPSIPEPLKGQLAEGGRLVIPVGGSYSQALTVVEREGTSFKQENICGCVFVPLIGEYGWRE